MRSGTGVIGEIGPKHPFQVPSVEHNHMIEAFAPDGSKQSFENAVLPWARCCRDDLLHVATRQLLVHCSAVHSIAITNCPWVSEIADLARRWPELDFGLHLRQTSEWNVLKGLNTQVMQRLQRAVRHEAIAYAKGETQRSLEHLSAAMKLNSALPEILIAQNLLANR